MKKRDTERYTEFSEKIKKECNFYDLQGLCKDRLGNYTIGVEAIDMEENQVNDYTRIFSVDSLCVKSCFAERLGAYFTLLLHKREKQQDSIYVKCFKLSEDHQNLISTYDKRLSEDYFINWWKKRQPFKQIKQYREAMRKNLDRSYFDVLFDKNETSWSGNIDAFTADRDGEGKIQITSLIECRYTSYEPISSYDPNRYFKSNGGDYTTWSSLIEIKKQLEVPLYLITYSRKVGYDEELGVAEVVGVDKEKGIEYRNSLTPNMNILHTSCELKQWMQMQEY